MPVPSSKEPLRSYGSRLRRALRLANRLTPEFGMNSGRTGRCNVRGYAGIENSS